MRVFLYDGREFPDPDPNMTVDEVRQSMSSFFPELANAATAEVKRGDDTVIEMKRRVGTKGDKPVDAVGNKPKPAAECRFCEHLKNPGPPKGHYIGTCELGLHESDDCEQFVLVPTCRDFEDHDPRKN